MDAGPAPIILQRQRPLQQPPCATADRSALAALWPGFTNFSLSIYIAIIGAKWRVHAKQTGVHAKQKTHVARRYCAISFQKITACAKRFSNIATSPDKLNYERRWFAWRLPRNWGGGSLRDRPLISARDLIGSVLVRRVRGLERRARIVETEAYVGTHDLACHASKGRTRRTEVMFGRAGHAYVYLIYGMYDMLNIVASTAGGPAEAEHSRSPNRWAVGRRICPVLASSPARPRSRAPTTDSI